MAEGGGDENVNWPTEAVLNKEDVLLSWDITESDYEKIMRIRKVNEEFTDQHDTAGSFFLPEFVKTGDQVPKREQKVPEWYTEEEERSGALDRDKIKWDNLEQGLEITQSLKNQELTPMRVGYIIYEIFNGKLAFTKTNRDWPVTITITSDESLKITPKGDILSIPDVINLLINSSIIGSDKLFTVSSLIMTTINQIPVITQYMPCQPLSPYVGLIHPQIVYLCAINALLTCMVCWPSQKLDMVDRRNIVYTVFPSLPVATFKRMMRMPKNTSIIDLIQEVNSFFHKKILTEMISVFSRMTASELTFMELNAETLTYESYMELIDAQKLAQPATDYTTNNEVINDLNVTITGLESISDSKPTRREEVLNFQRDIVNIRMDMHSILAKYELEELRSLVDRITHFYQKFKRDSSGPFKEGFEKAKRNFDKSMSLVYKSEDQISQLLGIQADIMKRQIDERTYNAHYSFVTSTIDIVKVIAGNVLNNFEINDNEAMRKIIEGFFKRRNLIKRVNMETGNIKSNSNLAALNNYLFTAVSYFTKEGKTDKKGLALMSSMRNRMNKLVGDKVQLPVRAVVGLCLPELEKLVDLVPNYMQALLQTRLYQFQLASSFSQAWSILLRIKGEVYEPFFAESWNLKYLPEDLKPTLLSSIRHTLPSYTESFILRSSKMPEVRDLKPDFILVKQQALSYNIFGVVEPEIPTIPILDKEGSTVSTTKTSLGTGISKMTDTKVFLQKDEVLKHQLGSDEVVTEPVMLIEKYIKNFISFAKKYDTKGGIIGEDNSQNDVLVETVLQPVERGARIIKTEVLSSSENQPPTTSTEGDTTASDLPIEVHTSTEEDDAVVGNLKLKVVKEDKLDTVKRVKLTPVIAGTTRLPITKEELNDEETKVDLGDPTQELVRKEEWKELHYTNDPSRPEIFIIEVGYQTDQERKIISDLNKWKDAVEILKSLGIKTTVLAAVDTTRAPDSTWWINKHYIRSLRRAIAMSFRTLDQHSPPDITEYIIGDISSQKLRSSIRTGSIIRPPILTSDILNYYYHNRDAFINRPSGVKLPSRIESDFIQCHVFGTTLRPDRTLTDGLVEQLVNDAKVFIGAMRDNSRGIDPTENVVTAQKFMLGWLLKDLESTFCKSCMPVKIKKSESKDLSVYLKQLSYELSHRNYCNECSKTIDTQDISGKLYMDFLTIKTNVLFHKGSGALIKRDVSQKKMYTHFDSFVNLSVPGKTQKQKKLKRLKKLVSEQIVTINKTCGYKDSRGQIFISRYYRLIQKNLSASDTRGKFVDETNVEIKTRNEAAEDDELVVDGDGAIPMDELLGQHGYKDLSADCKGIAKKIRANLLTLRRLGSNELSPRHIAVINELMNNMLFDRRPACVLENAWVEHILKSLKVEDSSIEFVRNIKETYAKMARFDMLDDTRPIMTEESIMNYLVGKKDELRWLEEQEMMFDWDCILFEELLNEAHNRLRGTVYEIAVLYVKEVIAVLMHFKWFQRICLYSKICQIFVDSCTEFTHSGIKIKKVPHTRFNLIIKVPEKKASNMICSLRESDMSATDTERFFMNRRIAIEGQALPYAIIVSFCQLLQTYNCVHALSGKIKELKPNYMEAANDRFEMFKGFILMVKRGDFTGASKRVPDGLKYVEGTNFHSSEVLISLLAGFNIGFGLALVPSMVLNSYIVNKQLQAIRYPFMASISDFIYSTKLGAKMSGSRRRIEAEIHELYLKGIEFTAISGVEDNVKGWKATQFLPKTSIPSISVFGSNILSDRHFVFDIYLVHIYNKEIDDFEDGQIRVFADFAKRHVEWESELCTAIQVLKRLGPGHPDKPYTLRRIRLLLCVAKLETMKSGRNCIKMLKDAVHGSSRREITLLDDDTNSEISEGSDSGKSTISTMMTRASTPESKFKTRSVQSYTMMLPGGLKLERGVNTNDQEIVKPLVLDVDQKPHYPDIKEDILEVIKHYPKHSYASYEMISLMSEIASNEIYNAGTIEKAKRSPLNWEPITNKMETTSIIKKPLLKMDLVSSMQCISRNITRKIVKLLKQRLDNSKDATTKEQKLNLLEFFQDQMLGLGKGWSNIVEKVTEGIKDTNNLDFTTWQQQVKLPLDRTLLTDDANQSYYWVKGVGATIKSKKRNMKEGSPLMFRTKELTSIRQKMDSSTNEMRVPINKSELEGAYRTWLNATKYLVSELSIPLISKEEGEELTVAMDEMFDNYQDLFNKKQKFESVDYKLEETALAQLEARFIKKHSLQLAKFFNLLLFHVLVSPWNEVLEVFELKLLFLGKTLQFADDDDDDSMDAADTIAMLLDFVRGLDEVTGLPQNTVSQLCKYVVVMFQSSNLPFKHLYDHFGEPDTVTNNLSRMYEQTKDLLAQMSLESQTYDFFLTVQTIRSKNFKCMKKLMGKSGSDRLPRSVRSKVIFELVRTTQDTKQAILQQQAFGVLLDKNHRNYATLAPKGQLGDIRDLLVQETDTKTCNGASEMWEKSLLKNSSYSILVTPKLKDLFLDESNILKKASVNRHGEPLDPGTDLSREYIQFNRTATISGDHTKWGPCHCNTSFNAMDQQILRQQQDWKNFCMLINLKSVIKQIEIPSPVIEKALKTVLASTEMQKGTLQINERNMSELVDRTADKWEWTGYMKEIVRWYIKKGLLYINSWNHMGQGIHHAKSDKHGDCGRAFFIAVCSEYGRKNYPKFNISFTRVGSSDDWGLCITVTTTCAKSDFESLEVDYKNMIVEMVDLWCGLSRSCQMYVSEKSVVSSVATEVYSDFDLLYRVSPSVIKFCVSTIVNYTVSTPLTIYRSMHVSSQQACMMSTPFLTNLMFCLCRQQAIYNHVEKFIRSHGSVMFKLPSSFGRLYVPKISTLLTSSNFVEDMDVVINSMLVLSEYSRNSNTISVEKDVLESKTSRLSDPKNVLEKINLLEELNIRKYDTPDIDVLRLEKADKFNDFELLKLSIPSAKKEVELDLSGATDPMSLLYERYKDQPEANDSISDHMSQADQEPDYIVKGEIEYTQSKFGEELSDTQKEVVAERTERGMTRMINLLTPFRKRFIGPNIHGDHYEEETLEDTAMITLADDESVERLVNQYGQGPNIDRFSVAKAVSLSTLVAMIVSYYDSFRSDGIERATKGDNMQNCLTFFEDPFAFVMPDSVRGVMRKLNLFKNEINSTTDDLEAVGEHEQYIARTLIESNNATESFSSEMNRVKQMINSRNIINKLSGGMKEHSLPIIRMMINSYFFVNKLPMSVDDHWSSAQDPSVRTTNNKTVEGKNKLKLRTWLEKALEFIPKPSSISTPTTTAFDFLLNPQVGTISYLAELPESSELRDALVTQFVDTAHYDNKFVFKDYIVHKHFLINRENCEKLMSELSIIVARNTGYNKRRLAEAEECQAIHMKPASHVIISKTRLFSKEAELHMENNPAVVMAFLLDPISAESTRPIGVKPGYLESDKQALQAFHPQVIKLINLIKNGKLMNTDEVRKAKSVLLNFCRNISADRLSSTPFYAFKPHRSRYEDSSVSIIKFGVIEGAEMAIDETKVFPSTFSEKYYRIMECISIISSLAVSDSKKSELLLSFLRWSPQAVTPYIEDEEGIRIECPDKLEEIKSLQTLGDQTIAVQLQNESISTKDKREVMRLQNIANLVLNPNQVGRESRLTDQRLIFKTEGDLFRDGRYQLSCEKGTSIGTFIKGKLLVAISQESDELLKIVEVEILNWCYSARYTLGTRESHVKFLELLPSQGETELLMRGGTPVQVRMRNIPGSLPELILTPGHKQDRCIYIKRDLMTVRTSAPESVSRQPKLKWSRGRLQIYLRDQTIDVTKSTYIPLVTNALEALGQPSALLEGKNIFQHQDIRIDSIKLPDTFSLATMYIMHIFMFHERQIEEGVSESSKLILMSKGTSGLPTIMRDRLLQDRSLEVIKDFALNKSVRDKEYEKRLIERIRQKDDITINVDNTVYQMMDGVLMKGIGTLKEEVPRTSPDYESVKKEIERKRFGDLDKDLELPLELPNELLREFSFMLSRRDDESRINQLREIADKTFKDIVSFPFLTILKNELGLTNFEVVPKVSAFDETVRWTFTDTNATERVKLPRDLFDAIDQLVSGQTSLSLSYTVLTQHSITRFVYNARKLIDDYRTIGHETTRAHAKATLCLMLYLGYLKFDQKKIAYDWVSLLTEILPFYATNRRKHGTIHVRIFQGHIASHYALDISSKKYSKFVEEVEEMRKAAEAELSSDIDSYRLEYEQKRKRSPNDTTLFKKYTNRVEKRKLKMRFNKDASLAQKIDEYACQNIFFGPIEKLKRVSISTNLVAIQDGWRLVVLLDPMKIKESIGLLKFTRDVLDLDSDGTQMVLGFCFKMMELLLGNPVERDMYSFVERFNDATKQHSELIAPMKQMLEVVDNEREKEARDISNYFDQSSEDEDDGKRSISSRSSSMSDINIEIDQKPNQSHDLEATGVDIPRDDGILSNLSFDDDDILNRIWRVPVSEEPDNLNFWN